jgi:hypothetical protein
MSRRPKLVEIGVPIGSALTAPPRHREADHSNTSSCSGTMMDSPCSSTPTEPDSRRIAASSLSRAAMADGIRAVPIQRPPTTYKVVIGGEKRHSDDRTTSQPSSLIGVHRKTTHIPGHEHGGDEDSLDAMLMEEEEEDNYRHSERYSDQMILHHPNHAMQQQQQHRWTTRTHLEIGAPPPPPCLPGGIEKMTGVQDLSIRGPLIVMDGANVAYAYAQALHHNNPGAKLQPHWAGISVAVDYLRPATRVVVVVPQPFLSLSSAQLRSGATLVAAPARDDDDAYVLRLALKERRPPPHGPVHVLSNDLFRDARDAAVRPFLQQDHGRISYAFADLGRLDDHGDPVLDFVPNPRHPFIQWMEEQLLQNHLNEPL